MFCEIEDDLINNRRSARRVGWIQPLTEHKPVDLFYNATCFEPAQKRLSNPRNTCAVRRYWNLKLEILRVCTYVHACIYLLAFGCASVTATEKKLAMLNCTLWAILSKPMQIECQVSSFPIDFLAVAAAATAAAAAKKFGSFPPAIDSACFHQESHKRENCRREPSLLPVCMIQPVISGPLWVASFWTADMSLFTKYFVNGRVPAYLHSDLTLAFLELEKQQQQQKKKQTMVIRAPNSPFSPVWKFCHFSRYFADHRVSSRRLSSHIHLFCFIFWFHSFMFIIIVSFLFFKTILKFISLSSSSPLESHWVILTLFFLSFSSSNMLSIQPNGTEPDIQKNDIEKKTQVPENMQQMVFQHISSKMNKLITLHRYNR